jgi:hypothetical protein
LDISLEKIDLIRDRTGLSYAEARELLDETGGDVLEALVYLENNVENDENDESISKRFFSHDLVSPVKKAFRKSNQTRIRVSNRDGTLLELPIAVGLVGALFAPRATALGAMALLLAQYELEPHTSESVEDDWEH